MSIHIFVHVESRRTNLGLDQDEVDEENDEVMFNIFVCKVLASGALREAYPLAE
jgi:hypothetical protein